MDYQYIEKLRFAYPFAKFLIKKPKTSLIIFLLTFLVFGIGVLKIESRFSARIWFDEGHPNILKLDRFERIFGSDETIGIGIYHPNGIFNEKALTAVQEITEKLWQVDDIIRVESLSNTNDISSEDDDIEIAPFIAEDFEYNQNNIQNLKMKVLKDETIPDLYISKDSTYSLIYGFLKPFHEGPKTYKRVTEQAQEIVDSYGENNDLKFFILGKVPSNNAFREISKEDNRKIVPMMLGFIIILLFIIFRSITYIVLPLVLAATTIGASLGLLGHSGIIFNNLLSAIPGILLAICLADALHVLFTFRHFRLLEYPSKKAAIYSLAKNFRPTILTSISTAISFFSISFTDIAPISDLGLIIAFGSFMAWLFTYLLIGPSLSLMANYLDRNPPALKAIDKSFEHTKLVDFIELRRKPIVIIFSLLTLLSLGIALQNEVNSDPIKYFDEDLPFRKAYDFTISKMSGLKSIELVIDSGVEEGVKNPIFLNKVERYINHILDNKNIVKVQSFINIIRKLNKALNGDKQEYYRIPDTQEGVAEILLFYTMGLPQGMDLNNQISLDNKEIRLHVVWDLEMSKEREIMEKWLLAESKKFDLKVESGGTVPIYNSINSKVVTTFFTSMGMAIILVSILLFIIFRDIFLSVFSMFPNVIPLIFGACAMKLMGNYIDIGTSIVYAVCLGIAVDDTIHFVVNYKGYRALGHSPRDSISMTFQITGKALIYTTLLLVVGFGAFILSEFIPNRNFGILCAITLLLALITDLIFLPALFLIIDKD